MQIEEIDRAAALADPAPRVPRKVLYWAIAALVVLGGGGALLERLFTSVGLNEYSVAASSATSGTSASSAAATTPAPPSIASSLPNFMGISRLSGAPAPPFTLTDQNGAAVSLASLHGKVVVLTFFDAACNDICPVLGREIVRAEIALGPEAPRVAFVAVNTDPRATGIAATAATSSALGLARYANWYFLTGSLSKLDPAWTHYGVTVEVSTATHRVAHTDLLYFLDTAGRERLGATPFANQSRSGPTTLSNADIRRFGDGLASYARQLLH